MTFWNVILSIGILYCLYKILQFAARVFGLGQIFDDWLDDPQYKSKPYQDRYKPYEPYEPYEPPKPYEPKTYKPFWQFGGNRIEKYLVDANTKVTEIFVSTEVIGETIQGNMTYSESATETEPVKLIRSGSGFRVYNHPEVPDSKWLSCR